MELEIEAHYRDIRVTSQSLDIRVNFQKKTKIMSGFTRRKKNLSGCTSEGPNLCHGHRHITFVSCYLKVCTGVCHGCRPGLGQFFAWASGTKLVLIRNAECEFQVVAMFD